MPPLVIAAEADPLLAAVDIQPVDRQPVGPGIVDPLAAESLGQPGVIEGRLPFALFRVDENELVAVGSRLDSIPEGGAPLQPVGADAIPKYLVLGASAKAVVCS